MKALLLSAALALPAAAQVTTVVEPVPDLAPVMLPIERDEAGVVKAQYIKPGDVTPEQYQRLLDEAAKVQAYQQQHSYIIVDGKAEPTESQVVPAPRTPAGTRIADNAPKISATSEHVVVKGDTLFNIAKRAGVSVDELKAANGMTDNNISLGQTLLIPAHVRTIVEPAANSAINVYGNVLQASQPAPASASAPAFAVMPGDTLYSISKRACTTVDALKSANSLLDNAISPGQRLALPADHCLK